MHLTELGRRSGDGGMDVGPSLFWGYLRLSRDCSVQVPVKLNSRRATLVPNRTSRAQILNTEGLPPHLCIVREHDGES